MKKILPEELAKMVSDLRDEAKFIELASPFITSINFASPIEPLLQIAIDILLRLATAISTDFRYPVSRTGDLEFSEFESDPLGNPKQKTTNIFKKQYIHGPMPSLASFLKNFAKYLVTLQKDFLVPFHVELKEPSVKEVRLRMEFKDLLREQQLFQQKIKDMLKSKIARNASERHKHRGYPR